MSGAGLFTPQLIQLAGGAAEGLMVVSAFYPGDPNPRVQAFVKEYQAKYGRAPSKFAAHTYDTAMIIADAIGRAGSTTPAKVRDALAATKDYQGLIGAVTIDKDRELVLHLRRLVVRNGQFVPWDK
jgi:branched-chain amino acid transport system substrate-binding protein